MISFRFPPAFIPCRPSVHPLMTDVLPIVTLVRLLADPVAVELRAVLQRARCRWTLTVEPSLASFPSPTFRSTYFSPDAVVVTCLPRRRAVFAQRRPRVRRVATAATTGMQATPDQNQLASTCDNPLSMGMGHITRSNSTTNVSSAFGGMTPGTPRDP